MQKFKVVILQDNAKLNAELSALFSKTEEFEVVGSAVDGIKGVELIKSQNPDFVVLELVLPGLDGLGVMEQMKNFGSPAKVIVLSAFSRDEIIFKAMQKGAEYFMVKPFNFDVLARRMKDCFVSQTRPNVEISVGKSSIDEKLSKIFISVGVPPHIKGYVYLREGVKMAISDPSIINNITKKLYPLIGEKFDTSASKVERAIRHAIEVAWNRGRIENINNILGVRAFVGAERPTNGEFIALIADKMLLEMA